MRVSKLRNKLLILILALFVVVFFTQFIFQNIFFDSYYINFKANYLNDKINNFENLIENKTLSKNALNNLTEKNKILISYFDNQFFPKAGNLFSDNLIIIQTDSNKEYTIDTSLLMIDSENLHTGSQLEAYVYYDETTNKYVASKIKLYKYDKEIDKTIVSELSYNDINNKSSNNNNNTYETLSGTLISYTNNYNLDYDHQTALIEYLYSKDLYSIDKSKTNVINADQKYLNIIQPYETGYIVGSISLKQSDEIIGILNSFNVYIILFTLVLAMGIGIYFSNRVVRPILNMKKGASLIANQDFSKRLDIRTGDELEELSETLNTISSNLKSKINELESYNYKLKQEYEERLQIEQSQKSLLMNISHDLKTPLTVIKGYLKAIKDGLYDKDKYIDITINCVDDINHTISEMIELTKYKSKTHFLTFEDVDLTRLIYKTYNDVFYLTKERNQQFILNIIDDVFIKADKKAIKKVLDNLILNAIKYSPLGAKITITLTENNNNYELLIDNAGVFIDNNDLEHIFEAFYRADKSRKESIHGNGLGLSIVKIILDYHNYKYSINNTNEGVRFCIIIDK